MVFIKSWKTSKQNYKYRDHKNKKAFGMKFYIITIIIPPATIIMHTVEYAAMDSESLSIPNALLYVHVCACTFSISTSTQF